MRILLPAFILVSMAFVVTSQAIVTYTWTGSDGDWSKAANWDPAGPPGAGDITDVGRILSTATGTINYDVQGPSFNSLLVETANPSSLTLNISAPLFLDQGALMGSSTATGLHIVVTSTGSITSKAHTSAMKMSMRGGTFEIEAGGQMTVQSVPGPWGGWCLEDMQATLRGAVMSTPQNGGANNTVVRQSSLTIDGGALDTDSLTIHNTGGVLLTATGGRLTTRMPNRGIMMSGDWSAGYAVDFTMLGGGVTNDSAFNVGHPNRWGNGDPGTNKSGVATVTLSGGSFDQKGYTSIGYGRVGNVALSGCVFRTVNDIYVGGGQIVAEKQPAPAVAVHGTLALAAGSLTATNTPTVQSATSIDTDGSRARFYVTEGTELWTGQRIEFTELNGVSEISTGITYYVNMYQGVNNKKCFYVTSYPGGARLGTVGTSPSAQWKTFPAVLSVGNVTVFKGVSRMITGTLNLTGGTLTTDALVATNGAASILNFAGGTLNTAATTVDTGSLLTFGDGVSAAVLNLAGGTHAFADGLALNANAALRVAGTNAIGSASLTGNLTLNTGAVLDWAFNASSRDALSVSGTVTLPSSATVVLRSLDASAPETIPLLTATGGFSGSGTAGWPTVYVGDSRYRAAIDGTTLQMGRVALGSVISIR